MNNDEAKFILNAYRSGGQDANDPQFREALDQARHDPDLARWFDEQRELDNRIGTTLRTALAPPPELKSNLLAQRRLVRVSFWRKPAWVATAIAASLALLLTVGLLFTGSAPRADFAQYRVAMAEFVDGRIDRLDLMSRDVDELRNWLEQQGAPSDFVLPAGLAGRPALGCRLKEWNGQKVSLLCFELENREVAHLLVIDRNALTDAPLEAPEFVRSGPVATVAWSRDDKIYLLASSHASESDLLHLL
jgi:hypothetical protein